MVTSDMLLQLITYLQSGVEVAQGRRTLLEYARIGSGARLALLFLLDEETQTLLLTEQSGRRPYHSRNNHSDPYGKEHINIKRIPLHGLFGSALKTQTLLHVSDPHTDPLILQEEQYWTWPLGHVILGGVEQKGRDCSQYGVIVLCFGPEDKGKLSTSTPTTTDTGNLLICISLLSAYLTRTNQKTRRSGQLSTMNDVSEIGQNYGTAKIEALSTLYEIGLKNNYTLDSSDLYQQILAHLSTLIHVQGMCLLLYPPSMTRLTPVACIGREIDWGLVAASIDSAKLQQMVIHATDEAIAPLFVAKLEQQVCLVPLGYDGFLVGALALAIPLNSILSDEIKLLLAELGHIIAMILQKHHALIDEIEMAVDQERTRIAHDIHDGVAQQIAHVLHKLEFIQRIMERQPQLALREVSRSYDLLQESLRDLRHGISSLIPPTLEEQGFESALQNLLKEYTASSPGVKVVYDRGEHTLLPSQLETPIFRFIQEALNNIHKHARASQVTLRIRIQYGYLLVEVSDNGIGFQLEQAVKKNKLDSIAHIGLRTMRERIQQAGGSWEIQSRPGEGTTLKARFPLGSPSALLTSREREVLRLLIDGSTNRVIAEKLSVSIETIKSHVRHIMLKMQAKDRTQAAVIATKQRWL